MFNQAIFLALAFVIFGLAEIPKTVFLELLVID